MDLFELIYVVFSVVFLLAAVVFAMWYSVPVNKAKLMRAVSKKNWVVAVIRHGGGQIKEHGVRIEAKKDESKPPTITIGDREYLPLEKIGSETVINFKGSVPVYFYNYDDVNPIALSGVDVEQKFRNPSFVNSIFMQVKALYRTMALKELMKLFNGMRILMFISIAGIALVLVVGILNYTAAQGAGSTCAQAVMIINQTVSQSLPNAFPGA